jgi:uncharacterized protein with PQ loop repeat
VIEIIIFVSFPMCNFDSGFLIIGITLLSKLFYYKTSPILLLNHTVLGLKVVLLLIK